MAVKVIHPIQNCISNIRKISEMSHTLPNASLTEGYIAYVYIK